MTHINCIVKEKKQYKITDEDLDEFMKCFYNDDENKEIDNDNILATEIEYKFNYILKELKQIAHYYSLPYRRIKKQAIINSIVEFETNIANNDIVLQRKHSWYCLEQLKEDKHMQKYILFL